MLYEIHKEIGAELAAKGVPFPVVYGPERGAQRAVSTRIVIERDRQAGDTFGPPKKATKNPPMVGIRSVGCVCRILAASTLSGPGVHDHERVADQIVDKLTIALHKVIRRRNTLYAIQAAGLMSADELQLNGLEQWAGVVYQIKFTVDRGVFDTTFAEEKALEMTIGGTGGASIGTTGNVHLEGSTKSEPLP